MISKWSNDLKIACLTVILALFAFLIIYTAMSIDAEYLSVVFLAFIALFILALFLKSDPRFRILGWSIIWTMIAYLSLGLFIFIYLLTFGPHGVC